MPTLYADRRQLDQLFRNLFSNALKFRGKAMPEIRVTASEEPEGWHFVVSDNGIGIEPGSLERIFGMFQRLHTADEYPGTGIGLAICQSIVERHGGRIWAESTPGSGTSIHFTIASQRPSAPPRTQETA
jgi:signal transduction histidine kinase